MVVGSGDLFDDARGAKADGCKNRAAGAEARDVVRVRGRMKRIAKFSRRRCACRTRPEAGGVAPVKPPDSGRNRRLGSKPKRAAAGRSGRAARLSRCSSAIGYSSACSSIICVLNFRSLIATLSNVKDEPRLRLAHQAAQPRLCRTWSLALAPCWAFSRKREIDLEIKPYASLQ